MTDNQMRAADRKKRKFLSRAKKAHGSRFNYEMLPMFIPFDGIVTLRCPLHGSFQVDYNNHVKNKYGGCKECAKKRAEIGSKKALEERIAELEKMLGLLD